MLCSMTLTPDHNVVFELRDETASLLKISSPQEVLEFQLAAVIAGAVGKDAEPPAFVDFEALVSTNLL